MATKKASKKGGKKAASQGKVILGGKASKAKPKKK